MLKKSGLRFEDRAEFRNWLEINHSRSDAVWLVFGKSGKVKTLKAEEALEEALCFGWIDGQIKSIDDSRYLKKFAQRRKKSPWSEKNKRLVDSLEKNGLMTEHGRAKILEAKQNGEWDKPKAERAGGEQIEVFTGLLEGSEPAYTNFRQMSPSVKRTYTEFYLSAKQDETKRRRLQQIIDRLADNLPPM